MSSPEIEESKSEKDEIIENSASANSFHSYSSNGVARSGNKKH